MPDGLPPDGLPPQPAKNPNPCKNQSTDQADKEKPTPALRCFFQQGNKMQMMLYARKYFSLLLPSNTYIYKTLKGPEIVVLFGPYI